MRGCRDFQPLLTFLFSRFKIASEELTALCRKIGQRIEELGVVRFFSEGSPIPGSWIKVAVLRPKSG